MDIAQKKSKSIAAILLIVLVFICFGIFLYLTIKNYGEYKDANYSLKEETSKLENKNEILSIVKQNEASIQKIDSLFVDENSLITFFDKVKSMAETLSIKVELLSIDNQNVKGLIFKYQASGKFENIYKFLKLLENMPYVVNLDSVKLTEEDVTTIDNPIPVRVWTANFELKLTSFNGKFSK